VRMANDHLIQSPVTATGSGRLLFRDDTIEDPPGTGIDVEGHFPRLVVANSTFTRNNVGLWVTDRDADGPVSMAGARITGNTFTGNGAAGLLLDLASQREAQGGVISGNKFNSNGHSNGELTDSSGHPVDNGLHINLPPSGATVTVAGNHALGNAGYGIYAVPGSVVDGGGNTSSPLRCVGVSCP
jgi:hypothetical protein